MLGRQQVSRWSGHNSHTKQKRLGEPNEAVSVSVGGHHICAVTTGGGIKFWGSGFSVQLGNGFELISHTPVDVIGFADK